MKNTQKELWIVVLILLHLTKIEHLGRVDLFVVFYKAFAFALANDKRFARWALSGDG